MQESLFGKTLEGLSSAVRDLGLPGYTAKQLSDWLYKKDALSFDEMTNLSKKARAQIASTYNLGTQAPIDVQESVDGTKKYLFPALPGKYIETAYIPDGKRSTLCVSSQVGCKMGCLFCMTGKQGFQGNLSAGEINLSTITDYTPHLLFGNILEDLRDKEFRSIVKENFTCDTVTMYKGQAETNWFETLSGGEDIIELVPSDYFEFGFCSHISSTMWASLLINHTLISSLRKKAVPTCSHPTMQRLLNRKMSRSYEKLAAVDTDTFHGTKDVSPFNLVLENLPNFELKSFEDIIETREKLKDELSEFRQNMCRFTGILKEAPYRKICEEHLDLLQMDTMQQALDNLRKKIASLNRKTLPKVVTTTPLNLLLQVTPALPSALALLAGSDMLSPATILNVCEKDFKDLPEKNGLSYVITIGKA